MWFRLTGLGLALALLAACDATVTTQPSSPTSQAAPTDPPARVVPSERAVQTLLQVQRMVEPVAEQECRARTSGVNCDFLILVDERPGQPPNAFQTLDKTGQPIIAFTVALIEDARNTDEIAFVMGHEAAHHIRGHIPSPVP